MTLARKDTMAGVLTALAVLVYAASDQGWNVWLVGSSHRWAAGAILLLGMGACNLGSPGQDTGRHVATMVLAIVGSLALVFAVWAIWTGSLTPLALLVVADCLLWGGSTLRHTWQPTSHGPLPI